MRVGVVGAGISGIATGRVLSHLGHDVTVFERGSRVGGVWQRAYPGVRLQNLAAQYRMTDFDWPFTPDPHPTREQIIRYLELAVERFHLDVRCDADVVAMQSRGDGGWTLEIAGGDAYEVDLAVLAVGQFSGPALGLALPGREQFQGQVFTDRDLPDMDELADRDVVVVGFGKTAVDLAAFAADRGSRVHHVFRGPRWLLPRTLLGVDSAHIVFTRASTIFTPGWAHPSRLERLIHRAPRVVDAYWQLLALVFRLRHGLHRLHRDPGARERMATLVPDDPIPRHMRSAIALAPDRYYGHVRSGRIEPHCATITALDSDAVVLADGARLPCDVLLPALGAPGPTFPYLPPEYRTMLEAEPDGPQLYRHVIHPRIPGLAFAGYNHSLLHVPCVESAALWLDAVHCGDLRLPTVDVMDAATVTIRDWKRKHTLFEPVRSCGVNARFQQYQDAMLGELGLRVRRKSNPLAEALSAYGPGDYDGILAEYACTRGARASLALTT